MKKYVIINLTQEQYKILQTLQFDILDEDINVWFISENIKLAKKVKELEELIK